MKIKIVQVGKTKDKYIEIGAAEMVKRIGAFAKVEFVTVKELSPEVKALQGGVLVALDENGVEMDSVEFSEFLGRRKDLGESIVFVIGGAMGLPKAVKEKADVVLSLSKMTFTHQMVRLFLLEQIYRAFCIMTGKKYHNE